MKTVISIILVFAFACLIGGCSDNTNQRFEAEINNLEDQIEQLSKENRKLKSEIDNLKSSPESNNAISETEFPLFLSWLEQESNTSERDMYESIIESFLHMDDEISRGWLDEGSIKFLTLIKGDAVPQNATTRELMSIYKSLDDKIGSSNYSIRDFFCVNNYGDSTNTGVYNFLETIDQLEYQKFGGKDIVFVNSSGNITGWNFDSAGGDAKVAEALGISPELVLIIMHAAIDAGFSVSFD